MMVPRRRHPRWQRITRRHVLAAAICSLISVLVACSGGVVLTPDEGSIAEPKPIATTKSPRAATTSLVKSSPAEAALLASQMCFDTAQVVVLAPDDEQEAITRASSLAASLGAPVLLTASQEELSQPGVPGDAIQGETPNVDSTQQPELAAGGLNTELV